MGVSRSCTCAMAYMMKTRGWTAVQTMRQFRANRDVRPNDDFLQQIVDLDTETRRGAGPRVAQLPSLRDLPSLAKPWHHDYWTVRPDPEDIPFVLRPLGDPGEDGLDGRVATLNPCLGATENVNDNDGNSGQSKERHSDNKTASFNFAHIELASENPFKLSAAAINSFKSSDDKNVPDGHRSRSVSNSSWEYYTETESEPEVD